jgi:hypothetical protein
MEKSEHILKIQPFKITITLLVVSGIVLIFSLLGQRPYETGNPTVKFFRELFTTEFFVNNNENIATFWNVIILMVATTLIFVIASLKNAQRDRSRHGWHALGLIFAYFTVDAFAAISHRLANLLRKLPEMQGGFLYNWLYPLATVIILLIILLFIWFYLHLDAPNKFLFPISIILYTLGAYKSQLISAYYGSLYGTTTYTFLLISHMEEFAEYVGVILLIHLLLTYLAAHVSELEFTA